MNIKEVLQWREDKKKENAIKWANEIKIAGECRGLTEIEFTEVSKVTKVKGCTHRSHSRGNLWSFKNTDNRETFKK
jgi:hypothetical protein|tara:strand:- start:439 stop:666 length:228 start_codon:yes stop_codon:yes gene_type:complete